VKEKKMSMTTETDSKPGRLTDSKWWFCQIGQHDKCAVEIELASRFEGCPCECHQKTAPQPAPDAEEEWYVGSESSKEATIRTRAAAAPHDWIGQVRKEYAAQIIRDHSAVLKLAEALGRRVSPTKCYCDVMLGAKCGECADRELLKSLGAALASTQEKQ
jgi:hypothetical protein